MLMADLLSQNDFIGVSYFIWSSSSTISTIITHKPFAMHTENNHYMSLSKIDNYGSSWETFIGNEWNSIVLKE